MLFFMFIVLSINPYEVDSKYNNAIANAKIASYKQSGLENEFNKIKDVTGKKVYKWLKDSHLQKTAAVATFAIPVIINKEVTITVNNFHLKANNNSKQLVWGIAF